MEEHRHSAGCLVRDPLRGLLLANGLEGYDGPVYVIHQHTAGCYADSALVCPYADPDYLEAYPNVQIIHQHDENCRNGCTMPETRYRIGAAPGTGGAPGGGTDAEFEPEAYVVGVPGGVKDTGDGVPDGGMVSVAYHVHGNDCGEDCQLPVVLDGDDASDIGIIACGKAEHTHGAGCLDAGDAVPAMRSGYGSVASAVMAVRSLVLVEDAVAQNASTGWEYQILSEAVAVRNESTGDTYPTLTAAVGEAASGDTLTLLQDISENVTVGTKFAGASLEIDLGGHTWTGTAGGSALFVSKAGLELTVRNGLMGSAGNGMINVGNAKSMHVSDVTFEGYTGTGDVAKCANSSVMDFVFERCSFKGNMVTGSSHYVVSSKGSLSLVDCSFEGNTSADAIIYATGASFALLGTDPANPARLDRNTGKYAIYCMSPSVEVSNVHAEGNISSGDASMNCESGGVGYFAPSSAGSVRLSNVEASGNKSGGYGGAFVLYSNYDVEFLMDGCDIHGNTSQKQGGGVYLRTGMGKILTAVITNTAIHGNKAYLSDLAVRDAIGGGLYVDSVSVNRKTTTSAVTLGADTRIYGNNVPDGDETLERYGADISLASGIAFTAYKTSKPSEDVFGLTQASLTFDDGYMFDVTDGDVEWHMSAEPRRAGTRLKQDGMDTKTPKYKWYWPVGYASEAVEPVKIYLCGDGDHAGEANTVTVGTLREAVDAAAANNRDAVYVCRQANLSVADEDLLNRSGVTFRRCPEHTGGYMFAASSDFVLDGAHIDGNNIEGDSALVHVTGGTLTIKGDTVIENGWNNADAQAASNGRGGGIRLDGGTLDMSGGTVRNCVARVAGGGIYGYHANMYFDGGEVSGNRAGDGGGLYLLGGESTVARFGTRGGRTVFSQNAATAQGGGVALNGGSHEVAMATFSRNSAMCSQYYGGGAIYIQTNTKVHMSNVFVTGNWYDQDGAETGAIACCPTGELIIYGKDGLMAANNPSDFDIRVSPFDANPHSASDDPLVHLPMTALGGAAPS